MGAWMCPLGGHGRFVYPYQNLTVMCDRKGCGYIDRRDMMVGTKVKKESKKKDQ